MALEIVKPGLLTTVQDSGRRGYAAMGFRESGACDKYSMKLANLLAGNRSSGNQAAVLEFTMTGGIIRFTEPEIIALTGADMSPSLGNKTVPMYCPFLVRSGDELILNTARTGLRLYLAVYGGIQVPEVMGSRSTDLNCGIGGFRGRALKAGDLLESGAGKQETERLASRLRGREEAWSLSFGEQWLRLPSNRYRFRGKERLTVLRAVAGPQEDAFTYKGLHDFVSCSYRLSSRCDRMACRLEGVRIEMQGPSDILSDGIVEGSVQVAADGLPMVMMADHQTTGGYAKIGTVISTDIPALAQLGPGKQVVFEFVEAQEGIQAYRKEEEKLEGLRRRLDARL